MRFGTKEPSQGAWPARFTIALALLATFSTAGRAQHNRVGTWASLAGGTGINTTGGVDQGKRMGGAVAIRVGGILNDNIAMGGEGLLWIRGLGAPDSSPLNLIQYTVTFGPTMLIYPWENNGLFFKGGGGPSFVQASYFTESQSQTTRTQIGVGGILGVGVDLPISRELSTTFTVDFMAQAFDPLVGLPRQVMASALIASLGLTWN